MNTISLFRFILWDFLILAITLTPVAANNPLLQFKNFTYEVINKTDVRIIAYAQCDSSEIEIPAEINGLAVTTLGSNSFLQCGSLTSITIPSSILNIEDEAFYLCGNLRSIYFLGNAPTLGLNVFNGTNAHLIIYHLSSSTGFDSNDWNQYEKRIGSPIKFSYRVSGNEVEITNYPQSESGDIVIPSQIEGLPVTSIGNSAFEFCSGLTSIMIPNGVTSIGREAFKYCSGLTSLSIPNSVRSIGISAFSHCYNIENFVVEPTSSTFTSLNGVLFNKDLTLVIRCPGAKTGTYVIPSSVTSIGSDAFRYCNKLTDITLPNSVTNMGSSAFSGCSNLTSVNIPNGINSIGYHSFSRCYNLQNVILPANLTSIGVSSFLDCNSLTNITIPSNVISIDSSSFADCANLTDIVVDPENTVYASVDGILYSKDLTSLIRYPDGKDSAVFLPDHITTISSGAFQFNRNLKSIVIPSSVTNIESYAFSYATNLTSTFFMGNAPNLANLAFSTTDNAHTFYYLKDNSGFTSPIWNDYPSQEVDLTMHPAASWLLAHDLSYDTSLNQDINLDGVSLIMAYAQNLNPNKHLTHRLPKAEIHSNQVRLKFYDGQNGVKCEVESSKDLNTWETQDVTTSSPDANGIRTAWITKDTTSGFLRLVVTQN